MPQGRVGAGVHRGGKPGNSNQVGGLARGQKMTAVALGPAPKGRPVTGSKVGSDINAAVKDGENKAKQNDGNAG